LRRHSGNLRATALYFEDKTFAARAGTPAAKAKRFIVNSAGARRDSETSSFAADGYKQSIRTIKGLKDAFLGVNDKL
jgi:hypothetical protein